MSIYTSCRDIGELTPLAQQACNLFLQACKLNGIDIFITETYRSQERQNYLYSLGRTTKGNIVTWTLKSNHTGRKAWDIACNGGSLYDVSTINKAGQIAEKLGITWGGSWNYPDRPHFEITDDWGDRMEDIVDKKCREVIEEFMANLEEERENKEVSPWAKEEVKEAVEKGITDGNRPCDYATREEVVAMINRSLKI